MRTRQYGFSGETERRRRAGAATLTAQSLVRAARSLGAIAAAAHEKAMGDLIEQGDQRLAEAFNDAFKPIVDWLLHFDLPEGQEARDGDDEV